MLAFRDQSEQTVKTIGGYIFSFEARYCKSKNTICGYCASSATLVDKPCTYNYQCATEWCFTESSGVCSGICRIIPTHSERYGPFGIGQFGHGVGVDSAKAVLLGKRSTQQKCLDMCIKYYYEQENKENISACQYEYWKDMAWGYYQKCFVYDLPNVFPSVIYANERTTTWLIKTCSKDEDCFDSDECTIGTCDTTEKRCNYKLSSAKNCNKIQGEFQVLAVRTSGPDSQTSQSTDGISNSLFGSNGNTYTMVSQFLDCSYDHFHLVPFSGIEHSNETIRNGVIEIRLNESLIGKNVGIVQDMVIEELHNGYGSLQSEVDFLMIFMPPGTVLAEATDWKAYAFLNDWISVFNDKYSMIPSIHMHEIGHNIGLGHSHDELSYGDESCMMGTSSNKTNGPKKCFNAPKSWQLGWYRDTQITIDADGIEGNIRYILYGISEYTTAREEHAYTAIKITNTIDNFDYYISFNSKNGINSDVNEGEDKVLVAKRSTGLTYADSILLGRLDNQNLVLPIKKNGKSIWINSKKKLDDLPLISSYVTLFAYTACEKDEDCNVDSCLNDVCREGQCISAFNDCSSCGTKISMMVITNDHPEQISWKIENKDRSKIVMSSNRLLEKNKKYISEKCLEFGNYRFEVIYNENATEAANVTYKLQSGGMVLSKESTNDWIDIEESFTVCKSTHDCLDYDGCTADSCSEEGAVCRNVNKTCANCNWITLKIVPDNYPDETTWQLKSSKNNEIIISGDPYEKE